MKIHMLLESNGHDSKPWPSYSSQDHRKHSNKASLDVRFLSPSHVTWRDRGGSRLFGWRICQANPVKAMHREQPLTAGIKSRASCKVYSSLPRRTTAVKVDGGSAAAEDDEHALGPEDSVAAVARGTVFGGVLAFTTVML